MEETELKNETQPKKEVFTALRQAFHSEPDYSIFEEKLETIKSFMQVSNENIVIFDYYKGEYAFYIAQDFLTFGYSYDYILKKGIAFSKEIIPAEEAAFVEQIKKITFQYIHTLPVERRDKFAGYINHHYIHKTGRKLNVEIRLTPFLFSPEGLMWMSIARMSLSTKAQDVCCYIELKDTGEKLEYSFEKNCLSPMKKINLTETEKKVLILNSRGFTEQEIADKMFISTNTIKTHKRHIFEKTNTKNFSEAFVYADTHRLF
ncbi:MAG: helix-turn-helix transcriptional regulator [Paludibacteraceae bacterium]|nr:helix-turn-helix transcriptional regulator [Paludibacteraceae bacterium]